MADGLSTARVLIRQLQGKLGVAGSVSNAGAVVAGDGFTSVKNSTGNYTVTFDKAFRVVPIAMATGQDWPCIVAAKTVSTINVIGLNDTGGVVDTDFDFIARPPS